jgi:hypothetical protein
MAAFGLSRSCLVKGQRERGFGTAKVDQTARMEFLFTGVLLFSSPIGMLTEITYVVVISSHA